MYDATVMAFDAIDKARKEDPSRLYGIVLLSDGTDTSSKLSLSDLLDGDAQLVHLELALQTVSARILRVLSVDARSSAGEGVPLVESLDALSFEAEAEAVDELVEPDAPTRLS